MIKLFMVKYEYDEDQLCPNNSYVIGYDNTEGELQKALDIEAETGSTDKLDKVLMKKLGLGDDDICWYMKYDDVVNTDKKLMDDLEVSADITVFDYEVLETH